VSSRRPPEVLDLAEEACSRKWSTSRADGPAGTTAQGDEKARVQLQRAAVEVAVDGQQLQAGPAQHGLQLGQGVQPHGVLAGGAVAVGVQQGVADPLPAAAQVEGPLLEHDQPVAGAGHVAVVPAADQGLAVGQLLEEAATGAQDPGHLGQDQLVLGVVLQVAEGVEQVEDGVEAGVGERQPAHVGLDQAHPPARAAARSSRGRLRSSPTTW
jgi:hypothetical protein